MAGTGTLAASVTASPCTRCPVARDQIPKSFQWPGGTPHESVFPETLAARSTAVLGSGFVASCGGAGVAATSWWGRAPLSPTSGTGPEYVEGPATSIADTT